MSQRLLKKGSWRKKIAILLVVVAGIFVAATFYIHHLVRQKIVNASGIDCHEIEMNLLSGCIDLHDLKITQELKSTEQLTLRSSKVHLHGLSYLKFLRQNKVILEDMIFENLNVEIAPPLDKEPTLVQEKKTENEPPAEIFIRTFQILDGNLVINDHKSNEVSVDSFTTKISELQYFPTRDSAKIMWGTNEAWGSRLRLDMEDSHYILLLDEISLTAKQELNIANLNWQPKRDKSNFTKPLPCRKSRLDINATSVLMQPFSLQEILFQDKFVLNSIVIENGDLEVFSDKRKEECVDDKMYFYEKLAVSDFQIHIDSIAIKNSKITFEELRSNDEEAGELHWGNIYASIFDVSNMSETQKTNTYVNIQANFLEETKLDVNFTFPNFDVDRNYSFEGNLDRIALNKFNSFLSFSKRLRIKTGELENLSFSGEGNRISSSGNMKLRYRNLDIDLLKQDGSRRKILSKLSNIFIGNKNNPGKNDQMRIGNMYSERRPNKSFISNWWKTLQSGMKSTILPNVLLPDELDVEK